MLSHWLTGGNFSISLHFLLRPLRLPRRKTKKQCKTQHHIKLNSDSKQHKIKSLLHRSVRLLFTSKKKSIDKDIHISNKLYVEKILYETLKMQKDFCNTNTGSRCAYRISLQRKGKYLGIPKIANKTETSAKSETKKNWVLHLNQWRMEGIKVK